MVSLPICNIYLIFLSKKFSEIHTDNTLEAEEIEKVKKNLEEIPCLSDFPEQNQKKFDRYNLRKSLAWDSAFLTGEGEPYYQLKSFFLLILHH